MMMSSRPLLTTLLLAISAGAVAQTAAPEGQEASIPFISHGGIRSIQADGDTGAYIQSDRRKWYYATTFGPCVNLTFATGIGVETYSADSLDRYGKLVVDGAECALKSLVTSAPPPPTEKKQKKQKHRD